MGVLSDLANMKVTDAIKSVGNALKAITGGGRSREQEANDRLLSDNWFVGEKPTAAQREAAIWARTTNDPVVRKGAYAEMDQMYSTPGSGYYNAYRSATSEYADKLKALGFDTSNINDDFFAKTADIWQNAKLTDAGSPTSNEKSSNQEKAANYLYHLNKEWQTTKAAKAEMDSLYQDISYWAGAGLTDAEIRDKVNGKFKSKYGTLQSIYDSRSQGNVVRLTEAVDFNDDTITGMIWSARNGGTETDWNKAAVKSYLGQGAGEPTNKLAQLRRRVGSKEFNPYTDGSNMHDERKVLKTDSFTHEWYEANADRIMREGTTEEREALLSVRPALIDADNASAELTELTNRINTRVQNANLTDKDGDGDIDDYDIRAYAEKEVDKLLESGDYRTLVSMDTYRNKGDQLELAYAVNYRREDMIERMVHQLAIKQKASSALDNATGMLTNAVTAMHDTAAHREAEAAAKREADKQAAIREGQMAISGSYGINVGAVGKAVADFFGPAGDGQVRNLQPQTQGKIQQDAQTTGKQQDLMAAAEAGEVNLQDPVSVMSWLERNQPGFVERVADVAVQEELQNVSTPTDISEEEPKQAMQPKSMLDAGREQMAGMQAPVKQEAEPEATEKTGGLAAAVKGAISKDPTAVELPEKTKQDVVKRAVTRVKQEIMANVNAYMLGQQTQAQQTGLQQLEIPDAGTDERLEFDIQAFMSMLDGAKPTEAALAEENMIQGTKTGMLFKLMDPATNQRYDVGMDAPDAVNNVDLIRKNFGSDIAACAVALASDQADVRDKAELLSLVNYAEATGDWDGIKDEVNQITDGIHQREEQAAADAAELDEQRKQETAEYNQALINKMSTEGRASLTEEEGAYLDNITNYTDNDRKNFINSEWYYDNYGSVFNGMLDQANWNEDGDDPSLLGAYMDEADQILMADVSMAQAAGMTLDEYYAKYPGLRMTPEQALEMGKSAYERKMDENTLPEGDQEGIHILKYLGMAGSTAAMSVAEGNVGFVADLAELEDYRYMRNNFTNYVYKYGEANAAYMYTLDAQTCINDIVDEGVRAERQRQLDEALQNGTDPFRVALGFTYQQLENAHDRLGENIQEQNEFVRLHGTKEQRDAWGALTNIGTASLQFAENALIGGLTGMPMLGSIMTYYPGQHDETYRQVKDATGDIGLARGSAVAAGTLVTGMENFMDMERLGLRTNAWADATKGWLHGKMAKEGVGGASKILNNVLDLAIDAGFSGLEEGIQENIENFATSGIVAAATGDITPLQEAAASTGDTFWTSFLAGGVMSMEGAGLKAAGNALSRTKLYRGMVSQKMAKDYGWSRDVTDYLVGLTDEAPEIDVTFALPAAEEYAALPAAEELDALPAAEQPEALPAAEELDALPAAEELDALPAGERPEALPAAEQLEALPAGEKKAALPAAEKHPALPAGDAATEQSETAAPAEEAAAPVEEKPAASKPKTISVNDPRAKALFIDFIKYSGHYAKGMASTDAQQSAKYTNAMAKLLDKAVLEFAKIKDGKGSILGKTQDVSVSNYFTNAVHNAAQSQSPYDRAAIMQGFNEGLQLLRNIAIKYAKDDIRRGMQKAAKVLEQKAKEELATNPEAREDAKNTMAGSTVASAVATGALNTPELEALKKGRDEAFAAFKEAKNAVEDARDAKDQAKADKAAATDAVLNSKGDEQTKAVEALKAAKMALEDTTKAWKDAVAKRDEAKAAYDKAKAAHEQAKTTAHQQLSEQADMAAQQQVDGIVAEHTAAQQQEQAEGTERANETPIAEQQAAEAPQPQVLGQRTAPAKTDAVVTGTPKTSSNGTGGNIEGGAEGRKIQETKSREIDPNATPKQNELQIFKQLAHDLGVATYAPTKRTLLKGVNGEYVRGQDYAAIREGAAMNENTQMHELGHAIQDKLGMKTTQGMLDAMAPGFASLYSEAERPFEAFAEFVKSYITDKAGCQEKYGYDDVLEFERRLRDKDMFVAVDNARLALQALNLATNDKRIDSRIVDHFGSADAEKTASEKRHDDFIRFMVDQVDDTFVARDLDNAALEKGREKEFLQDFLQDLKIADKVAGNLIEAGGNLADSDGYVIGKSLSDTLELTNTEDARAFVDYAVAMMSLDRMATGQDVLGEKFDAEDLQQIIDRADQKTKDAFERYEAWWDQFMQTWMVDTGLLSQESKDYLRQKWPHYVPLMRDVQNGTFKFKAITKNGSTRAVINPLVSMQAIVVNTVKQARRNDAMRILYDYMQTYGETGEYCREISMNGSGKGKSKAEQSTELITKIENALAKSGGNMDQFTQLILADQTGESIQEVPDSDTDMRNVIAFTDKNGTKRYIEFANADLLNAMTNNANLKYTKHGILDYIAKVTRAQAALTTANNPMFGIGTNPWRDIQTSTTYGSWAVTNFDAIPKWIYAFFRHVNGNSDQFKTFKASGGGGFDMLGRPDTKAQGEKIIRNIAEDYGRDNFMGQFVKKLGSMKDMLTASKLGEKIEATSRFVEFQYGKDYKGLTPREKQRGAQAVTLNFNIKGNSQLASDLRKITPFYNASVQGTYRAVDMFSKRNRDKLARRVGKTILNYSIMGALSGLLVKRDKKEDEYDQIAEEMRYNYFILPVSGDPDGRRFARLPLGEDVIGKAAYLFGNQMVLHGEDGEFSADFTKFVGSMFSNLIKTDTIFNPVIGVIANKNYYGGMIVSSRLSGLSTDIQYNETTPELFIRLSRMLNAKGDTKNPLTSPLGLQYMFQQYTGVIGQIAIPMMSGDKYSNYQASGLNAAWEAVKNRFTIDPAYTNDITDAYYDGLNSISGVVDDVSDKGFSTKLAPNLTAEQSQAAVEEAKALTASNGRLGRIQQKIASLRSESDSKSSAEGLTREQRMRIARDYQDEICRLEMEGLEIISEYQNKYCGYNDPVMETLNNIWDHATGNPKSLNKALPSSSYGTVFTGDSDKWYMQAMTARYEATGKDTALPKPNQSPKLNGKTVSISKDLTAEQADQYHTVYRDTLEKELNYYRSEWNAMDDEEIDKAISNAKKEANSVARDWLEEYLGVD